MVGGCFSGSNLINLSSLSLHTGRALEDGIFPSGCSKGMKVTVEFILSIVNLVDVGTFPKKPLS